MRMGLGEQFLLSDKERDESCLGEADGLAVPDGAAGSEGITKRSSRYFHGLPIFVLIGVIFSVGLVKEPDLARNVENSPLMALCSLVRMIVNYSWSVKVA